MASVLDAVWLYFVVFLGSFAFIFQKKLGCFTLRGNVDTALNNSMLFVKPGLFAVGSFLRKLLGWSSTKVLTLSEFLVMGLIWILIIENPCVVKIHFNDGDDYVNLTDGCLEYTVRRCLLGRDHDAWLQHFIAYNEAWFGQATEQEKRNQRLLTKTPEK